MLADPAALERMSRNGLEATKDEFNWGKEKVKLVALYQSIFQEPAEKVSCDESLSSAVSE